MSVMIRTSTKANSQNGEQSTYRRGGREVRTMGGKLGGSRGLHTKNSGVERWEGCRRYDKGKGEGD